MNHPHMRQRGTVRQVSDRILGDFQIPGSAYRFSEFPEDLPLEAPLLGEHNAEVLREYLGYSEQSSRGTGSARRAAPRADLAACGLLSGGSVIIA